MLSSPLGPNERKILNTIRQHGILPRHKIVEHVDVTAQAIGQITRKLDQYHLLIHHKAVKVGLGQPPKPISINPDGAFSMGIKIGRRRTDVLLVDLLGHVRQRHTITYAFPVVHDLLPRIEVHVHNIQASLNAQQLILIGIGVAAPFALGGWHQLLGLSEAQASEWQNIDLEAAIGAMTTRPVRFAKDTAAACIAELLNGHGRHQGDFLYIFIDTFIGGGVVSQGRWLETHHGNAGAIASVPIGARQLLDFASLWELEQRFAAAGLAPMSAYDDRALDAQHLSNTEAWLASASEALASAIVSGTAFLDCRAVVIDGSMSTPLLSRLIDMTSALLGRHNWQGLWQPQILVGSIGQDAGALGGALLPLNEYFYT